MLITKTCLSVITKSSSVFGKFTFYAYPPNVKQITVVQKKKKKKWGQEIRFSFPVMLLTANLCECGDSTNGGQAHNQKGYLCN